MKLRRWGGLDSEVGRESNLTDHVDERRVAEVLNRINVRKGHCYYLPSGTIHALGAGVVVAEVQTPSDVTYRIYDWDRVDPSTGQPRELHLTEALGCISYDTSPIPGEIPEHVASVWTSVTSLVRCPSFVIERVRMVEGVDLELPYQEMVIWIVLEGRASIPYEGAGSPMTFGASDTVLIPAGIRKGRVRTETNCMWLEVTIPVASSLAGFERPSRSALQSGGASDFVPLNPPDGAGS